MSTINLPKRGQWLLLDGTLFSVVDASIGQTGVDLVLRGPDGKPQDKSLTLKALSAARVAENDGKGKSDAAFAALWGSWMRYTSPRLRSAALATRSIEPFAHQDEAVFDHMLPQPRLRFLLADEPGTGKTVNRLPGAGPRCRANGLSVGRCGKSSSRAMIRSRSARRQLTARPRELSPATETASSSIPSTGQCEKHLSPS